MPPPARSLLWSPALAYPHRPRSSPRCPKPAAVAGPCPWSGRAGGRQHLPYLLARAEGTPARPSHLAFLGVAPGRPPGGVGLWKGRGVPLGCLGTVRAAGWEPGTRAVGKEGTAGEPHRSPGERSARLPGLREAGSHGDQARREAGGGRQDSLHLQPLAQAARLHGLTLLGVLGPAECGITGEASGSPAWDLAAAQLAAGPLGAPWVRRLGRGGLWFSRQFGLKRVFQPPRTGATGSELP